MPRRPAQITQADIARVIRPRSRWARPRSWSISVTNRLSFGLHHPQVLKFLLRRLRRSSCDRHHTPPPPHLVRQVTRHGAMVWYVRVGKGQRIRLRKDYGTPEFEAEYQAAISGTAQPARTSSVRAGSLSWLVERYRESTSWTKYSLATRRQRENIFKQVIATAGDKPVTGITRAAIVAGRDRRSKTPFQGRHFLDAMRGLFRWALDAQHVKSDPTQGVAYPARNKSAGYKVWTEPKCNNTSGAGPSAPDSGVARRVALFGFAPWRCRALWTAAHRDNVGTIQVQKSGGTVTVTLPILPVLAATLKPDRAAI